MKARIVIIRHGITEGNEKGLYYGSTDVPLAERGIEELKKEKELGIYPDSDTAMYFTSGMRRAEQSFEIIYGNKEHETIPTLRELDFGDFEMKTYEELNKVPEYQEWISATSDAVPPPNGESIRKFTERVESGFKELLTQTELQMLKLRNEGGEALAICICHGGVISGIMDHLWPGERDSFYAWIPNPGHGYILYIEDGSIVNKEEF